jgi:excisionase family DNA binding protein
VYGSGLAIRNRANRGEIGMIANTAERPRDKLTIAEVCADLGISRRTFYEWRAKKRAPKCIRLPNGDLRIRRAEYQRWLEAREEIS